MVMAKAINPLEGVDLERFYLNCQTREGAPVVIRTIEPDDKYEMLALYPTLSQRSLYMRFFRVIQQPTLDEIERYTRVDPKTHLALVALWGPEQRLGAAGRLIRATPDSDVAELSCLVIDELQHRGLGRLLNTKLVEAGRLWGITRVIALVHSENTPMLRLLKGLGYPTELVYDEGEFTVTLDTHNPPCRDNATHHATLTAMHQGIEP
ncbi:GNAT family N-acetyltransferase [Ferrimonas gelatinilytica]|uniref:GNAT family N-acetyltransferase n=2 Tax=Ferrimonas gelatinilytica TaxID=1255257 RepID=A0ABP9RW18_9GAMM